MPIKDRKDEVDQIIQRIIKREESRSTWHHINATWGIQRMSSVHEVTSSNGHLQILHTTQDEVEKCIINEVSKRFRLTEEWSPFWSSPLATVVGLLGKKETAVQILNGTFTPSFLINKHTKAIIELLKIPDIIRAKGPIDTEFTAHHFS
jgi:hypothetical protein